MEWLDQLPLAVAVPFVARFVVQFVVAAPRFVVRPWLVPQWWNRLWLVVEAV